MRFQKIKKQNIHQRGFIGTILVIIAALIILGYFKIDLRTVVSEPVVKDNLNYVWQLFLSGIMSGWNYIQSIIYH